jgi:hypothetical protein
MTLRPDNERLLAELELYVVATEQNRAQFDPAPFGLEIAPDGRIDPLRCDAAQFLHLLSSLDAATFSRQGVPMPRSAFYEAAELPGGIVGFACRAVSLPVPLRKLLQVSLGYTGLVPLSLYLAIPTLRPGVWVGYSLISLRERFLGDPYWGLGRLTKAVALKMFRASTQIGVTQWNSQALRMHALLGPLRLLTAWTPAHAWAASLTYSAALDDGALRRLAGDPSGRSAYPMPELHVDSDDHATLHRLQARIEAGERLCVAGMPEPTGPGQQRVPIATWQG